MLPSHDRVARLLADALNEAANDGLKVVAVSDGVGRLVQLEVCDDTGRILAYAEHDRLTEAWKTVWCS